MLFTKNDYFFMRQYMAHTILSLNEVYQINKEKTNRKNKIDFVRKLLKIIFHTLDLNLLKVLSK